MSDLLAIFARADEDPELLNEIAAYRPGRVTVLIEDDAAERMGEDSSAGAALRDRLARLMATIESRTGATVLGVAGDRAQLTGWSFDRELAARTPLPA
jgi:hypothetical protein